MEKTYLATSRHTSYIEAFFIFIKLRILKERSKTFWKTFIRRNTFEAYGHYKSSLELAGVKREKAYINNNEDYEACIIKEWEQMDRAFRANHVVSMSDRIKVIIFYLWWKHQILKRKSLLAFIKHSMCFA
ncbi:hypothetical protein PHYBLDRAFT_60422 [Phycomyces blakesleeanus NRRL 1555(-)]|uniref:Uncharacterized protein n=1 Tax=Phycomyces blakesleeanus (strain ATCC 8743b / DSM 1359 / FGSC 10004 / NBRC 33097 / NRRL 1555) TaxID=763407 RepID=A0A167P5N0_PHYB8|nr:hypothetical protein PHYBLDRAFT_60422 [Phycomyces blakesleeanus NRRL 1555(-)]OAD77291.1 hypothetical protein PHYBLDRAFT_60422 [Phycomyces blakesleeanus NRRL 1555(-)]|eukprot:XP_018295331.1 hypothetical protein PHYBLDRAFT_60422 [Phycomyces blakesleeanus NRRL 1555(-)]